MGFHCIHLKRSDWWHRLRARFMAPPMEVAALAFSRDGHKLASLSRRGLLEIWDARTLSCVGRWKDPGKGGRAGWGPPMAFSADERSVFFKRNGEVAAWSLDGSRRELPGEYVSFFFDATELKLLRSEFPNKLQITNGHGVTIQEFKSDYLPIGAVNDSGDWLATASSCDHAHPTTIWDLKTSENLGTAPFNLADSYCAFALHPTQPTVAWAVGKNVHICNPVKPLDSASKKLGHQSKATRLAWNQDGSHLAVGTTAGEVEIWHIENSRLKESLRVAPSCSVSALAWGAGNALLALGGEDGSLHLFGEKARTRVRESDRVR